MLIELSGGVAIHDCYGGYMEIRPEFNPMPSVFSERKAEYCLEPPELSLECRASSWSWPAGRGRKLVTASLPFAQVIDFALKSGQQPGVILNVCGETGCGKNLLAKTVNEVCGAAHAGCFPIFCCDLNASEMNCQLDQLASLMVTQKGGSSSRPSHAGVTTLLLDKFDDISGEAWLALLRHRLFQGLAEMAERSEPPANLRIVISSIAQLRPGWFPGWFRHHFRLVAVRLSPLRDRCTDILSLTDFFLTRMRSKMQRPDIHVTESALQALLNHHWPGNVRELRQRIEQAAQTAEDGMLTAEDLCLDAYKSEAAISGMKLI